MAPAPAPTLSLVVPVRDEVENVGPVLVELFEALRDHVAFEVVLVDDGSRDGTPDRLRSLAAAEPRLRVLVHGSCRGKSAALWTGVEAARAEWVATMDGDGQNDPVDVLALCRVALHEASDGGRLLVAGERASRCDTWPKRCASRVANSIRGALLRDSVRDSACGLKVFRRAEYLALPRFEGMHRFLPALMLRGGARVVAVPVTDRRRRSGRSKYGLADRGLAGVRDLLRVLWLGRSGSQPR
jgi:dolichol-phosphate mannosyltransferase